MTEPVRKFITVSQMPSTVFRGKILGSLSTGFNVLIVGPIRCKVFPATTPTAESGTNLVLGSQVIHKILLELEDLVAQLTHDR